LNEKKLTTLEKTLADEMEVAAQANEKEKAREKKYFWLIAQQHAHVIKGSRVMQ